MRINNALAPISQHKHLIIVVIGIAAIASYMIPFGNLFAIADASHDYWKKKKIDFKDQKKKKFDFKFAKFYQKFFFKNFKFIDNSERTTNTFSNFGNVDQFFKNINSIDVYAGGVPGGTTTGGTTTPVGSIALNQGSNFFFVLVQNCPSAAGSGSGSTSTSSTSCQQNPVFNIQTNSYASFGGSV
jgi:hypothetical protein